MTTRSRIRPGLQIANFETDEAVDVGENLRCPAVDREGTHEIGERADLFHYLAGLGVDDRQHRRFPRARNTRRSVARKDRLARPSHDVNRGQQRAVRGVDHVPLRRAERRRVNRCAIRRQREPIAAVPVVGFLPDDFLRDKIERGETFYGAEEQTPALRAGRDAADLFGCCPGGTGQVGMRLTKLCALSMS